MDTAKSYNKKFEFNQNIFQFMKNNGERVHEIHIHDFHKRYDQYQVVGDGFVDFNMFKGFLFIDDIFMNFEVRPVQAAKESKRQLIEMVLCEK